MKRSILMLLVMSAALISFGCEKIDPQTESVNDLETASLKAAKVKVEFTGTCDPTGPNIDEGVTQLLPNGKTKQTGIIAKWYDTASDPLLSGYTLWYENITWDGEPFASNGKMWGKTELFVDDPDNADRDAPHIGLWEMTWHGYISVTPDGNILAYCDVVGHGKEGVVKGLTAKWTYTLDMSMGFYYSFAGYYK